jgi:hypothetical protein
MPTLSNPDIRDVSHIFFRSVLIYIHPRVIIEMREWLTLWENSTLS